MKFNKFPRLSLVLSFIISVIVVVLVSLKMDWGGVLETFGNINWGYLILAWVILLISYVLRTLRFQTFIQTQSIPFLPHFAVTTLYGMYNYILPIKSGEASYVILLNRRFNVSLVDSATTLISARYFDFASIALILPFVLMAYWSKMPNWMAYASLAYCCIFFAFEFAVYIYIRNNRSEINHNKNLSGIRAKVSLVIVDLLNSLIKTWKKRKTSRLLLITSMIWLCIYTYFYLIVLALGYPMDFFHIVFVSMVMVPLTLFPFQGFAFLGTHEVGWTTAFLIMGYDYQTSLSISVNSHIIIWVFMLLMGGISLLLSLFQKIHARSNI